MESRGERDEKQEAQLTLTRFEAIQGHH